MIFVVLGTWGMPFIRPLKEIEQAVLNGVIKERILIQSGNTSFASPHMESVPFFGKEEFERTYDQASLIICQAGVGSIMLGLKKSKRVIAIARRAIFHEHIDDHQLEILYVFEKLGAILRWNGDGDLGGVLARANAFVSAGYPFAREKISGAILDYLRKNVQVS